MEDDSILVIDQEDMGMEITIDEQDIQQAVSTFVEWNQDIIVINPDELDLTPSQNQGFYEKIRRDILAWAEGKGIGSRYLEYILLAPDFFILLVRLVADGRVPVKLRTILVAATTYFVWPLDAMPEALLGPVGYLDDVVFAALGILVTLKHIDETIVREHWSGKGDIVTLVEKIASTGEALLKNPRLWEAFKRRTGQ